MKSSWLDRNSVLKYILESTEISDPITDGITDSVTDNTALSTRHMINAYIEYPAIIRIEEVLSGLRDIGGARINDSMVEDLREKVGTGEI